jgi:hypothetical protein
MSGKDPIQLVLAEMTRFVGQWVIAPETVPVSVTKMHSQKLNGPIPLRLSTRIISAPKGRALKNPVFVKAIVP